MKISVSFYRIYFHPRRKISERQYINELTGSESAAIESLKKFFNALPSFANREKPTLNKSMDSIYHDKPRMKISNEQISGILQVGENGFASEIHDGESGKHRLSRTPKDIEYIPLYYLLDGMAECKDLLLCIQNFGNYGIASKLIPSLRQHLKQSYPDYVVKVDSIHLGPIVFDSFVVDGVAKEIEAVLFKEKTDLASDNGKDIKIVMNFGAAKRGGEMPHLITNLIRKNASAILDTNYDILKTDDHKQLSNKLIGEVTSLLAVNLPDGYKVGELSAIMSYRGVKRKIDLGNIHKHATRYDITRAIQFEKNNGHPVFESIDEQSKNILINDIRKLIGK